MSHSLLEKLRLMMEANPLQKKVLLTDRFAIGNQWAEQLGRMNGGHALNLNVRTPQAFLLEQARLDLFEKGLTYTNENERFWIIHALMHELGEKEDAYLPCSKLSPGILRSFHEAILEMRHAGLRSEQMVAAHFENEQKGRYVRQLLERYERYLQEHARVDDADLPQYVRPIRIPCMLIIEDVEELTPVQLAALKALAPSELCDLQEKGSANEGNIALPQVRIEFFHALGPVAETREIFRRMAERGIRWDEVEIIASDYRTYAPILQSFAMNASIPCTFSQGLPAIFSKAGQAAVLFLDWLESDYQLALITHAIQKGILCLSQEMQESIRFLERSGIGWGRDRYSRLSSQMHATHEGLDLRAAQQCHRFFAGVLDQLPDDKAPWSMRDLLRGWLLFLEAAPTRTAYDSQVKQHLKQWEKLLADIHHFAGMSRAEVIRFGREMVEDLAVGAEGTPAPGKLMISSLQDGGQSGRKVTFLIGMDEDSWAGKEGQDPVLLDEERTKLSPYLRTSVEKGTRRIAKRNSRLQQIYGACTCSFSSFRISDSKSSNPANEMLVAFRRDRDRPDASIEEMVEQLGRPVGYVHSASPIVLDQQERWMKRLTSLSDQLCQGTEEILSAFENLAEGEKAARARADLLIGAYEGVITPFEPTPVTSVSKLEMYARCPMQFFYQEVLRVRPKEVAAFDRTKWLSHTQRGSLLHAIFYRYAAHTRQEGGSHDLARLQTITEEELSRMRREVAAPSIHILQKESEEIRRDVEVFYATEKKRGSSPRYLELPLHQPEEMFQVELSEEFILPLRGYVDRVEEVDSGRYRIVDYKTGSPRKYKESEFFSKGTQLQQAVYAAAVEQWLQTTGADPSAQVVDAVYSFPTAKGQGHQIIRKQNRREETAALVSCMIESISQGIFPPTREPANCTSCAYGVACRKQAENVKEKREAAVNQQRLSPLLEVEDYA